MATQVIVLLTEAATGSPFVFHEVLFADWLGKKLVSAMFKNVWSTMRASLKAVLGNFYYDVSLWQTFCDIYKFAATSNAKNKCCIC